MSKIYDFEDIFEPIETTKESVIDMFSKFWDEPERSKMIEIVRDCDDVDEEGSYKIITKGNVIGVFDRIDYWRIYSNEDSKEDNFSIEDATICENLNGYIIGDFEYFSDAWMHIFNR